MLFIVAAAFAGDPCPIDFRVSNLGPLPKDGAVPIEQDTIFSRLVTWLGSQDCVSVSVVTPKEDVLPLVNGGGLQVWRLQALLTDKAGAFRCTDAHTVMAALSAVPESGHVIYQRGTRRVLLTTASWGTMCMDTTALETDAGLKSLWDGATKAVVADRHANP
jgi:hypothetical protein